MRKILTLPLDQQKDLLWACAYLSWLEVHFGNIQPQDQEANALAYGHNFDISAADYQNIYATVFPTNGPPQKP